MTQTSLMKYVVVADPFASAEQPKERPILIDRDIQHSHVVPKGWRAVSGGFVVLCGGLLRVVPGQGSESLHVMPRPQDEELLRGTLALCATALGCSTARGNGTDGTDGTDGMERTDI